MLPARQGMGDSIVLYAYDMYRLCTGLKTTPAALLASSLELGVVDGLILPHLKMNGNTDSCTYLNKNGRCSIHPSPVRDSAALSTGALL